MDEYKHVAFDINEASVNEDKDDNQIRAIGMKEIGNDAENDSNAMNNIVNKDVAMTSAAMTTEDPETLDKVTSTTLY